MQDTQVLSRWLWYVRVVLCRWAYYTQSITPRVAAVLRGFLCLSQGAFGNVGFDHCPPICPSIHPSINPSMHPSVHHQPFLSFICLSILPNIYLSIHQSIYHPIHSPSINILIHPLAPGYNNTVLVHTLPQPCPVCSQSCTRGQRSVT